MIISSLLKKIAFLLVVIGGLNWGLIGIFNWDLVRFIFQRLPEGARAVYTIVGLSALYIIYNIWVAPSATLRDLRS